MSHKQRNALIMSILVRRNKGDINPSTAKMAIRLVSQR